MPIFQWTIFEANLDPVVGAEQKGTRPVLVVSNEEFITGSTKYFPLSCCIADGRRMEIPLYQVGLPLPAV